jgi:hypothetical protein
MRAEPKANTRASVTLPALASPLNGMVEIAGIDQFRLDERIHEALSAPNDPPDVTTVPHASCLEVVPSEAPSSSETARDRQDTIRRLSQLLHGSAATSRA